MDGFGDSFVPPTEGTAPTTDVDPAAEFLAREQDQLAGLGDDIIPPAAQPQLSDEPPPATGKSLTYLFPILNVAISQLYNCSHALYLCRLWLDLRVKT